MGRQSTASSRRRGDISRAWDGMEVEFPHPPGEQQLLQPPQVVVPQIGLLPVEKIEPPRLSPGQILFQLLISGRIGLLFGRHSIPSVFSLYAHRVLTVTVPSRSVR